MMPLLVEWTPIRRDFRHHDVAFEASLVERAGPMRMVVSREGSSPRLFFTNTVFHDRRIWRGVVRRDDAAAYADYIASTGMD
jgi:hypothetical protein